VIDENKCLSGVIVLDDVRQLMFETEKYDEVLIRDIMTRPPETIQLYDDMSLVMKKFEDTQTWNLPVIKDKKYFGFISKSAIFSSYRTQLVEDLGRD
jgi:CIC family chloride channel protein